MTNETHVESSEIEYSFRTNKETGYKRPSVALKFNLLTAAGIAALLSTPETPEAKLAIEAVNGLVTSYVRGLVDSDTDFDQAKLDALIAEGKISLEAIANLPKSERNVLSKDDLEAFAKVYIATMPGITGKSVEKVSAAAGLFVERFRRVAGDNEVLAILQDQLNVFMQAAEAEVIETHSKALTFLVNKLEELLSVKVTKDAL